MMYAKNKTTKETAAYEIVCRQMKQVVKASNVRGWRQEQDSFLPLNVSRPPRRSIEIIWHQLLLDLTIIIESSLLIPVISKRIHNQPKVYPR